MMKINGKAIAVEEHGEGEPMVLVHGLGGTSNSWHPQVGILSRSFRVVRLDLEGSGRSPVKGKLSIASFALRTRVSIPRNVCETRSGSCSSWRRTEATISLVLEGSPLYPTTR